MADIFGMQPRLFARPGRPCHVIAVLMLLVALVQNLRANDTIPAPPQTRAIALVGGDVYTVSGDVLRGATVVFDQGKIVAVGTDVAVPDSAERIDVKGKRIYPGLIESLTTLGLEEIGSTRATLDSSETGRVNPNARAETAINPDSELIPVARSNGILTAIVAPEGGVVSGSSAAIKLDGWTWEEMTLRSPVALHLNWPSMMVRRAWWTRETEQEQLKARDEQLIQIRDLLATARSYAADRIAAKERGEVAPFDARLDALVPLVEGKLPLVVRAEEVQQIRSAVAFARREKIKLIIAGGQDAEACAEMLKQDNVPVVIDGVQRQPLRKNDPYDAPLTLPERLRKAGVRYCIASNRGASSVRNLPYHAGTAVAYGLSEAEALCSVTLYAAQIFGIADRVGSIETGKDATLIVTDGNILETPTHVEAAYIEGRKLDLSDKQKRLYEKYQEKYERSQKSER